MSGKTRELQLKIGGKLEATYPAAFRQAIGKLEQLQQKLGKVAKAEHAVKEHGGGHGNIFAGLLGAGAALLSMEKIEEYLHGGIEMAERYETQLTRMEGIMRRVPGTTAEEIEATIKLNKTLSAERGIRLSVLNTGSAQLAMMNLHQESIAKLMPALTDMAHAQYGVNVSSEQLETTSKLIGKALNGNTGALRRAGIFLGAHIEKMLKTGSEEEKVAIITAALTQKFSGMSKQLMSTGTGKLERLHILEEKLQRTLGEKLLPLQERWMTFIVAHMPMIEAAFNRLLTIVDGLMTVVWKIYNYFSAHWTTLAPLIGGISAAFLFWQGTIFAVNTALAVTKGAAIALATTQMIISKLQGVWLLLQMAIQGGTAATFAFNAALGATPIGVIAVLVATVAALGIKLYQIHQETAAIKALGDQAKAGTAILDADMNRRLAQGYAKTGADRATVQANIRKEKHVTGEISPSMEINYLRAHYGYVPTADHNLQQKVANNIPAMAAGGIVTRPTLALIGERGPEMVTPLPRGGGHAQPISLTVNVTGGGSPAQTVQAVQQTLPEFERMLKQVMGNARRTSYAG